MGGMRDIVYFDLETKKSFGDVGGSRNKDRMGVSVAVTFSTKTNEYRIYPENELNELIDQLIRADLVVGFNHVDFDYPVLQGYTILDLASQTVNLDMLVSLEEKLGHRIKLDSVASASLGVGKTADGLDALKWWQEHQKTGDPEPLFKIAEYCAYDVKVTMMVHQYGVEHGHVKFADRSGNIQEVEVDWK
jgi:DEAD/DEAH box helicase domain-containing protein